MPRTPQEIAADFAAKPQDASVMDIPPSVWDRIKAVGTSAIESPGLMGAIGGTVGLGFGGPAGAALGAAGGAGYAHTARALDPTRRATQGVEDPSSNAVDMVGQAAINAAVPVVSKLGGPVGRLLQTIPSAPMPKGWGEAGVIGGLSMIPDIGHGLAGAYGLGRAASVIVPPVLRGLGRAMELGGSAVSDFSGSLAPAVEEAAAPMEEAIAPTLRATGASNVTHLPQVPAQQTVKDLLDQGVPLEEAIAAAAKGEPSGMAESLRGLFRSAGESPEVDLAGLSRAPKVVTPNSYGLNIPRQ